MAWRLQLDSPVFGRLMLEFGCDYPALGRGPLEIHTIGTVVAAFRA